MLRRLSHLKAATSLNGILLEIPSELPRTLHYEGAWTDSWAHRRCFHNHRTLLEAAECARPEGPSWYVFAVENGKPRELSDVEESKLQDLRRSLWPLRRSRGTN